MLEVQAAEWRPIPGTDGIYTASSLGQIRRELTATGEPSLVRGSPNNDGYWCCAICLNGRRTPSKIHSLVALAFLGPRPPGYHVNHKSGDKSDNRLENLEYVTLEENLRHAKHMGIAGGGCFGSDNACAKLTEQQVRDIRRRWPQESQHALADEFGVTNTNISCIVRRKTWRHLPEGN